MTRSCTTIRGSCTRIDCASRAGAYGPKLLVGNVTSFDLQGLHNPSPLDFLADVANSAGNYPNESSKGTAAAAVSAGTQPINGILKVCGCRVQAFSQTASFH